MNGSIIFSKTILSIRDNGFLYTVTFIFRLLFNFLYRTIIFQNPSLQIDYTSRVKGLRYINVLGIVVAGKHFWLHAISKVNEQTLTPQIIFKGNFSASDFCHIGATHYVEIGNNVLFGSKVYVTDHGHGIYSGDGIHSSPEEPPIKRYVDSDKEVIIGDNVWVGDNVTILPNVHIGSGCIIGSNSVVTKDIPSNCIAVGIPAKVIKNYDFEKKMWVKISQ